MKALVTEGYLTEKADTREVTGRMDNATYRVCTFLLSETKKSTPETSITLTLWNEDIEKYRVGDHVSIQNGYVTVFNEQIQLNVGRYGKIQLVTA